MLDILHVFLWPLFRASHDPQESLPPEKIYCCFQRLSNSTSELSSPAHLHGQSLRDCPKI